MIVARIDSYLVQATAKRHGSCWLGCATITITHDGIDTRRHKDSVIHFGLEACSEAAEQAALDEARRHIRRRNTAPMEQTGGASLR